MIVTHLGKNTRNMRTGISVKTIVKKEFLHNAHSVVEWATLKIVFLNLEIFFKNKTRLLVCVKHTKGKGARENKTTKLDEHRSHSSF